MDNETPPRQESPNIRIIRTVQLATVLHMVLLAMIVVLRDKLMQVRTQVLHKDILISPMASQATRLLATRDTDMAPHLLRSKDPMEGNKMAPQRITLMLIRVMVSTMALRHMNLMLIKSMESTTELLDMDTTTKARESIMELLDITTRESVMEHPDMMLMLIRVMANTIIQVQNTIMELRDMVMSPPKFVTNQ